jgi:hypothetical protein
MNSFFFFFKEDSSQSCTHQTGICLVCAFSSWLWNATRVPPHPKWKEEELALLVVQTSRRNSFINDSSIIYSSSNPVCIMKRITLQQLDTVDLARVQVLRIAEMTSPEEYNRKIKNVHST